MSLVGPERSPPPPWAPHWHQECSEQIFAVSKARHRSSVALGGHEAHNRRPNHRPHRNCHVLDGSPHIRHWIPPSHWDLPRPMGSRSLHPRRWLCHLHWTLRPPSGYEYPQRLILSSRNGCIICMFPESAARCEFRQDGFTSMT